VAGFRTWTDDDYLNAAAINGYLMGQVVTRFASEVQRDAELASPVAGMISYVTGLGLQRFTGAAWVNLVCPAYTTAGLPPATGVPVGTAVWDRTLKVPLWSDGIAWKGVAPASSSGVVTLVDGTAVVATSEVTDLSRILLTTQILGGTVTIPSALAVSTRVPGESFTILASDATDTSTVAWSLTEPPP
jgi:hypothetical protein